MRRWFRLALKIANQSEHEQHRLGALVIRGGAVLSAAPNSKSLRYGLAKRGKHAEARALQIHGDYEGATLFVARTNGLCSRPCASCMARIKEAQVSRIVYSDWQGNMVVEKVV